MKYLQVPLELDEDINGVPGLNYCDPMSISKNSLRNMGMERVGLVGRVFPILK